MHGRILFAFWIESGPSGSCTGEVVRGSRLVLLQSPKSVVERRRGHCLTHVGHAPLHWRWANRLLQGRRIEATGRRESAAQHGGRLVLSNV
eukprot:6298626-Prymnesium_polylepis.1